MKNPKNQMCLKKAIFVNRCQQFCLFELTINSPKNTSFFFDIRKCRLSTCRLMYIYLHTLIRLFLFIGLDTLIVLQRNKIYILFVDVCRQGANAFPNNYFNEVLIVYSKPSLQKGLVLLPVKYYYRANISPVIIHNQIVFFFFSLYWEFYQKLRAGLDHNC